MRLLLPLTIVLTGWLTAVDATAQGFGGSTGGGFASQGGELQIGLTGGGALGSRFKLTVIGEPDRPYWTVFNCYEERTEIVPGLFLEVPWDRVNLSIEFEGLVGVLSAAGYAEADIFVPDDPALIVEVASMQALYTDRYDTVSNLVRLTPQVPGTFQSALDEPALPVAAGVAVRQDDGDIEVFDTALGLRYRYQPELEEFDLVLDAGVIAPVLSTTTALPDGRILIAGGLDLASGQPTDRCILFDPQEGDSIELQMSVPRAGHAAAVTDRGEVLLSGGFSEFDITDLLALFAGIQNTSDVVNFATDSVRTGPDMLESKAFHTATATADGDVLVAGGLTVLPVVNVPLVSPFGYLYSAGSDSFGLLPLLMGSGRMAHGATLLDDGRVLVAGGINIDFTEFLETGDILDLVISALDNGAIWEDGFLGGGFDQAGGLMGSGRALPAVTAQPDGGALVAGGFQLLLSGDITEWEFEPQASADLLRDDSFVMTGSMAAPRIGPIAVPLPDGTVLVLGGTGLGAEIYE